MRTILLVSCLALSIAQRVDAYPGVKDTGGIQFLSSEYGPRVSPMGGSSNGSFHSGTDIACRVGTPVLAISDGVVVVCAYGDRLFGRYMVVRDGRGIDVLYGHLSATWIPRGTAIKTGAVLGLSGNTGQSTGPHLHLQVMMSIESYLALTYKQLEASICH